MLRSYIEMPLADINLDNLEKLLYSTTPRATREWLHLYHRIQNSDRTTLKKNILTIMLKTDVLGSAQASRFKDFVAAQANASFVFLTSLGENIKYWINGVRSLLDNYGLKVKEVPHSTITDMINALAKNVNQRSS